jgi:hypothetical protein
MSSVGMAAETFPRRDASGRVVSLRELLVAAVLGTLVALAVVAVIDAILALIRLSHFGDASGWLALILPGLLFFDDLRGWRGYGVRFLVALVGAGVAVGLGLIGAALFGGLAPLISGGVGALIAAAVYAPVWFLGIRWLTGHNTERRTP